MANKTSNRSVAAFWERQKNPDAISQVRKANDVFSIPRMLMIRQRECQCLQFENHAVMILLCVPDVVILTFGGALGAPLRGNFETGRRGFLDGEINPVLKHDKQNFK